MVAAAMSVPLWLATTLQVVEALAAALAAVAALVMSIVNWRKLDAIHKTVRDGFASPPDPQ